MSFPVYLVAAVSQNSVIGREGGMPWHLPTDLKRFRDLTLGRPIIMGRKTWDSLGRPLPGRANIVITRNHSFTAEGAMIAHSFLQAHNFAQEMAYQSGADSVFVIGGSEIFREGLAIAQKIFLTEILSFIEGDSFSLFDKENWTIIETRCIPKSDQDSHPIRFVTYERR
ncbi:dihydrofolate reductase [Bartonella ancashensis]|uniref:Dihydrofolate reductase n=1 Tax=Bartonella ancashensis TaxID=1318743 RepID=A0A0M4M652_9HYPH|nr:dihydrofolate reductase [Bartonella ancashensis]ALE03642.1 Dihydrofolate reductase [Bartonella ancashensis]